MDSERLAVKGERFEYTFNSIEWILDSLLILLKPSPKRTLSIPLNGFL